MRLDKHDWQAALDAQSACNLSGIAHGLMDVLRKLDGMNTQSINGHPIVRLYVAQMAWLSLGTSYTSGTTWEDAYAEARKQVAAEP